MDRNALTEGIYSRYLLYLAAFSPPLSPYLKLHDKLIQQRHEVVKFLRVWVFQKVVESRGDVGKDFVLETHYHAMQKLPHAGLQEWSMNRDAQTLDENIEGFSVNFHTAALLHCRLVGETFTGAAERMSNTNKYYLTWLETSP